MIQKKLQVTFQQTYRNGCADGAEDANSSRVGNGLFSALLLLLCFPFPIVAVVEYNKQRLHKASYFRELLSANEEIHPSIRPLLKLSRETIERCQKTEDALVSSLQRDPALVGRIKRLRTVPGVGPIRH